MMMRSFLLILLGTAALYASPALAEKIEAIPLAPPPGQQGSSGVTPAPSIPTNIPPVVTTPHIATPATTPPAGSSSDDMSGGASSAYDIGVDKSAPAATSRERDMGDAQTSAPIPITPPAPYKQTVRDNPVIRMGTAPPDDPSLENRKFCTLKIAFSSFGTGTDRKTDEKIKAYLASNSGVLTYTTTSYGREGEHAYCLDINQHNHRAKIYRELKNLLPPKGVTAPETKLSGEGFLTVTNSK